MQKLKSFFKKEAAVYLAANDLQDSRASASFQAFLFVLALAIMLAVNQYVKSVSNFSMLYTDILGIKKVDRFIQLMHFMLSNAFSFGLLSVPILLLFKPLRKALSLPSKKVLPIVFLGCLLAIGIGFVASFIPSFQTKYPFYKTDSLSLFLLIELAYFVHLFFVEWMFRGVMVRPLIRIMGTNAFLFNAMAYMLFHIGKPPLELLSSFFGGFLLAYLSFRWKSLWPAFLWHACLALSLDFILFFNG